jgi:hypothetical protein
MGKTEHLSRPIAILLATGLLLVAWPLFGAILWLLQYSTTPPILPPIPGQPGFRVMGAIPIGILLIALSLWLNSRSKNNEV